jgi:hypothetical protein
VALGLCLTGPVVAQQPQQPPEPAEVSRVFFVTPKAGMEMQFEAAVKKHAEWHAQKKDPWRWDARFTETGRRTGEYVFIAGGHQWKDFDNPPVPAKDDGEHFLTTVGPYVDTWSSLFLVTRRDFSRAEAGTPPPPISTVVYFYLKIGQTAKFANSQRQIREALDKTNAPTRSWWYQVSGAGRNTTFVVSIPRANWAAFEGMGGPTARERVEQVFGRARADAIYEALDESIEYTETKITVARPDLSYIPK